MIFARVKLDTTATAILGGLTRELRCGHGAREALRHADEGCDAATDRHVDHVLRRSNHQPLRGYLKLLSDLRGGPWVGFRHNDRKSITGNASRESSNRQ